MIKLNVVSFLLLVFVFYSINVLIYLNIGFYNY